MIAAVRVALRPQDHRPRAHPDEPRTVAATSFLIDHKVIGIQFFALNFVMP